MLPRKIANQDLTNKIARRTYELKHIFIINPNAGAVNAYPTIKQTLAEYDGKLDYELYQTKDVGDATAFVIQYCEKNPQEMIRFYSCGGDGTLNEVASGVMGHQNASMTCYPCGSGNDFVKYYGDAKQFMNIDNLIHAKEESIDIMKVGDRYCINVCNFGFDSCVAKTMIRVKRKKIIGGKNAYNYAVFYAMFHARKNKCSMKVDGNFFHSGDMLLCTISNGSYVGGSYFCAPRSKNNDGLMEICLVKPISIIKFISLMAPYKKGKHLDEPRFEKFVSYLRGKNIEIDAPNGFAISIDGEIVYGTHFMIETQARQLQFAVPQSVSDKRR